MMLQRRSILIAFCITVVIISAVIISRRQQAPFQKQQFTSIRQYLYYANTSSAPKPIFTGNSDTDPFVNAYLIFANLPVPQRDLLLDQQKLAISNLPSDVQRQILKFVRATAHQPSFPSVESGVIHIKYQIVNSSDEKGHNIKRPGVHLMVTIAEKDYDLFITQG